MQQVKGYSPLTTGLLFLPLVAGILVASTLYSVVLLPRVGPRPLITAGMLLSAGGTAYLAQLTVTSSYLGGVLPALLIIGLGFGMIFAPSSQHGHGPGVPRQDSGVASALVERGNAEQVGGSIGICVLSTIAASATTSYLIAHHTGPQGTSDRGDPRLHPGLHDLSRTAQGSARSSRSSCCPHGSGLKNSPAKPRPWLPTRAGVAAPGLAPQSQAASTLRAQGR